MYAYNVSRDTLLAVARACEFDINADTDGNRVKFTLRLPREGFSESHPQSPLRFTSLKPSPKEIEWVAGKPFIADGIEAWKWRKSRAVCFHGHYEFLEELFKWAPEARVISSYYGKVEYTRETFEEAANAYGDTRMGTGSNIYRVFRLRDCCNCEEVKRKK